MRIPVRTVLALSAALTVLLIAGVAAATAADTSDDRSDECSVAMVGPDHGPDTSVGVSTCPYPVVDPPAWDDPSAATPVQPRPGMTDVRARMFDRAIVHDDGTVTILFTSGVEPCAVLDHVDVAYGDDAVTVTLFEGRDAAAGDVACIEIAVLKSVTISLDQALDGRQVVDGATHTS
ncbi:MAG TPA: hypothetical protein VI341_10975 [Actinomycetota bacterium]